MLDRLTSKNHAKFSVNQFLSKIFKQKVFSHILFFTINFSNFTAFTLAEVLIVLGIIGIVASMTIPSLVKDYQKQVTISQLQKAFSTMSQAFTQSTIDNGFSDTWDWSESITTTSMAETYLVPYLSIMENCGENTHDKCKSSKKYNMNGTVNLCTTRSTYNFILQDGTQWFLYKSGNLLDIGIDLNGDKTPNKLGKDVFFMRITNVYLNRKNRVFFIDPTDRNTLLNSSSFGCNETATLQAGLYCGALIQMDGWKISNEYPW